VVGGEVATVGTADGIVGDGRVGELVVSSEVATVGTADGVVGDGRVGVIVVSCEEATVGTAVDGIVGELGSVGVGSVGVPDAVEGEAVTDDPAAVELQLFGKRACADEQDGSEMLLVSSEIAPVWQRRRPMTLVPVSTLIEACAMIVP